MNTKIFIYIFFVLLSTAIYSQNITNTLGTNGSFIITDGSITFLNLDQSNGFLTLNSGVIQKGSDTFIHSYSANSNAGLNTFVGLKAGNFTMGGSNNWLGSYNTGMGYSSLTQNTTGSYNSAFGVNSLTSNTEGYHNSAFGYNTLKNNTTGTDNSAFGAGTLQNNTTGSENCGFGPTLALNTTGHGNSAFGYSALVSTTTGSGNSAFGRAALSNNISGVSNSAFGDFSSSQNDGFLNAAFGYSSLGSATSSSENVAIGANSLFNCIGNNNTALGSSAGFSVTSGTNLTLLGYNAQPSSGSVSDEITIGNGNVTAIRANVQALTSLSDMRDKKNIKDLNLGIEFLMKLKPRIFNWDKREWYENKISDGSKINPEPTAGFIAQELDQVQKDENAEWLNLVMKNNPEKLEATYGNLLPIIVKAVQDLKLENDQLKRLNSELNQSLTYVKMNLVKIVKQEVIAVINETIAETESRNVTVNNF